MRLSLLLILAAFASPALAQTNFADSTGGYVAINGIAFNSGGPLGIDATLGYRFGGGLDVGLRAGTGFGESSIGPTVGVTKPLGLGFSGRVAASALYVTASGRIPDGGSVLGGSAYSYRNLSEDLTLTVSRLIRLAGSFRIRPTVGVFTTAFQRLSFDVPNAPSQTQMVVQGGLHVETPLSFRLFGQEAAFVPAVRLNLAETSDNNPLGGTRAYGGGGLRLNF